MSGIACGKEETKGWNENAKIENKTEGDGLRPRGATPTFKLLTIPEIEVCDTLREILDVS